MPDATEASAPTIPDGPGDVTGNALFSARNRARPSRRASAWVFLLACSYLYLISFRGVTPIWLFNQGESGMWLDEAERVLAGEVLYRDFFDFVGPGVVYVNAGALAIVGSSAAGAMLIPILVGGVLAVLFWRLASRLLDPPWTFAVVTVFLVIVYAQYNMGNHKWLAWLFGLAALDVLSAGTGLARSAGAGLLLGLSMLCTQDTGLALTGGALIANWPTATPARRRALALAAFATTTACLGYFVALAGWRTVWYDLVVFPLTRYLEANDPALSGGVAFGTAPTVWHLPRVLLQWGVSIAGVAGAVLLIRRARRGARDGTAALGAWAYAVWPGLAVCLVASLPRPLEPMGLSVRAALLILPAAAVLAAHTRGRARSWRVLRICLSLAVGYVAASTVGWRQLGPASHVEARAGAIWSPRPLDEVAWIQAHAGVDDVVFLFPDKGGLHFLTRTRNPTSFAQLQDMGYSSPNQIDRAIAEIEATRPSVGVFDRQRLAAGTEMHDSTLEPLRRYLERNYASDGMYLRRR
jgi:hypothetical protein